MKTLAMIALLAAPAVAQAAPRASDVEIAQAWARPAAAGMTGGGFMTVRNSGKAAVVIRGAESPVARMVHIHRTQVVGGVASMDMAKEGVTVPPGGSVRFAPGGLHLMMMGLTRPLKAGEIAPLTLLLSDGRRIETKLAVRATAPQP